METVSGGMWVTLCVCVCVVLVSITPFAAVEHYRGLAVVLWQILTYNALLNWRRCWILNGLVRYHLSSMGTWWSWRLAASWYANLIFRWTASSSQQQQGSAAATVLSSNVKVCWWWGIAWYHSVFFIYYWCHQVWWLLQTASLVAWWRLAFGGELVEKWATSWLWWPDINVRRGFIEFMAELRLKVAFNFVRPWKNWLALLFAQGKKPPKIW